MGSPYPGASSGQADPKGGDGRNSSWQPAGGGPPPAPAVSLPRGGGAIRDLGETFAVSPSTGTASLTVPVTTSQGRAGFGPALSLGYDSGAGNGPFGLGWKITLPLITRKTDKGLPCYRDDPDADTFIVSGAEDLVPIREDHGGRWSQRPRRQADCGRGYSVQGYRPRIEGLFSRIERWRDLGTGETHWRTISSANVTTIYGATAASRVADPANPAHVYSWLICASFDDTGHAAVYDYQAEDRAGVDTSVPSERNRTALGVSAARYPKRIRYGNLTPWHPGEENNSDPERRFRGQWMFEAVFDYGDHDPAAPRPEPDRPWPARPDPFSTYRPGFEVRTYRRCQRVLMFHHFPAEPDVGQDCLVCSTDLSYASTGGSGMTTVTSVTHRGYRRLPGGGYHREALPPLDLRYSQPVTGSQPRDLPAGSLRNLPAGIDQAAYQWVDLDGEGLSGILARQGGAWFYKANLGGGRLGGERMLAAQPAMTAAQPAVRGPGPRAELLDLAGSGRLDLAELGGPAPGFYQRSAGRGWQPFRPFPSLPAIDWDDADLRLVDLDGDGLADVLITGDDAFTWYPSLGPDGFGDARRAVHPWGEERGPRLMLADPEQAIYLADMSGDGLSDLVRVRNGEVCYWPNTGYGSFGAKVTMDRSPWLDQPGRFDQRRVRLADVDGTGSADLIYLHPEGTRLYLSQSGNGYGEPHTLSQGFPRLDSLAHVMVADLLGHGTACLVWSSPLPGDAGRQMRYIDLMTQGKPYLLTRIVNNLGAETEISYAPSTRFYLADARAGRPWITRLPFPVQVVERVRITDRVNKNRFTTRHSYHHGYFDGFEREFRGFAMIEHIDTGELAVLEPRAAGNEFSNLDPATDLPPVLTRTWLHTGVFRGEDAVTRLYASEYYSQPGGDGPELPDSALPGTLRLPGGGRRPWRLSATEAREACRALKGQPLRVEVYALDGSEAERRPYSVSEYNYTIELLQPAIDPLPDGPQNYHAVFLTHARESVTAHHERALYPAGGEMVADPRITHEMVLAADEFGNPLRSASAGYGRRFPDPALSGQDARDQGRLRLTVTDSSFTNPVDLPGAHRTPMPSRTRVFEVAGLGRRGQAGRMFGFGELRDALGAIRSELPFQDWDAEAGSLSAPARRLISDTRVRYRRDDLSGPLAPGVLESRALPFATFRLAFTGSLLTSLYGDGVDAATLIQAGYVSDGENWQIPSGRVFYSPGEGDDAAAELGYARRHFFLPQRFRDPFGNTTAVSYDRYDLLVSQTRDALGNLVTAGEHDLAGQLTVDGNDYRVLAPRLVSDPNRNRSAVAFDTLARICGTAVMGKPEERLGDSLAGFETDPPAAEIAAYFADPFGAAHRLLGEATSRVLYDLDAYRRSQADPQPQAAGVAVLTRERHVSDLAPGQRSKIQRRFSYSDGFGREIQHKGQAAAGPVTDGGPEVSPRWICSGWTVCNNKGKPVRSYEPFFTAMPGFEFAPVAGVSATAFYDPPGRVVATLHPDGSYGKITFDPWRQDTWDTCDTVLLDPRDDPDVRGYAGRYLAALSEQPGGWATWYARRIGGGLGLAEQRAARQAAEHAGTPARSWLDTLGRTFLTRTHNRVPRDGQLSDQYCRTRSALDIQGNEHEARDELGRLVVRYGYPVSGGQVAQAGLDSGGGQTLPDVTGKPVYARTARGFVLRTSYDALHRPVRSHVAGPGIAGQALQSRTEYGESAPGAEARNLRTRIAAQYDGAGVSLSDAYDFKGNLLGSKRQLAAGYADVLDWAGEVPLEEREYPGSTSYDALNRPVAMTRPDGSVMLARYDPASMLSRLDGRLRGESEVTTFVARLEYNARGQRTLIGYGNGAACSYSYDPLTFRLASQATLRQGARLQDLRYTYDPAGNPVAVDDHAQQRIFFRNQVVSPGRSFSYDALYRLIRAAGREHIGQAAAGPAAPGATDVPRTGLPAPGDGAAMARYTERYDYDVTGNLLRVAHRSSDAAQRGWTRDYSYGEPSLLEPSRHGNRLTGSGPARAAGGADRAAGGPGRLHYDEQGNTTAMPEIPVLGWDYADRLHASARQAACGGQVPQTTYYVYDASGQRARKVTQRARAAGDQPPPRKSERIYLGPFEIYREYAADGSVALERETLHVFDGTHRVALAETRTAGTDPGPARLIRYQLADRLESSVLELSQDGQVISFEEYYPYGSTSCQAVRARTETPKRYRYTGRERDTETGLAYHGARYYIPWLARWLSPDPAGLIDGPNLYRYARNNPMTFTDPHGTDSRHQHTPIAAKLGAELAYRHPKGFTLAVPNRFERQKIRAYKQRINDPLDRGVGIRSRLPGQRSSTDDIRAAHQHLRNDYEAGLPGGQRPAGTDIDHTVELQHISRGNGAPGADHVRPQDHRVQNSRVNSSEGSQAQKLNERQVQNGAPRDTSAGGVARQSDMNKLRNTQGYRTAVRSFGYYNLVGGTASSLSAVGDDIREGNAGGAAVNTSAYLGGAFEIGGIAARSSTLLSYGRVLGAPAAVASAAIIGVRIGTNLYDNYVDKDFTYDVGSRVENATGSRVLGATAAAGAAVADAVVHAPVAAYDYAKSTWTVDPDEVDWDRTLKPWKWL